MLHLLDEGSGSLREVALGSPVRTAAIAGVGLLGAGLLVTGIRRKRKQRVTSKKVRRKAASPRRKRKAPKKSRVRKVHKHKTKHRGTKKIHYTTKGQPYIILANGRARFIKHSSARVRKKRKGGFF